MRNESLSGSTIASTFFPNSPQNSRNSVVDNRINRYCLVTSVSPVNIPNSHASNASNGSDVSVSSNNLILEQNSDTEFNQHQDL